MNLLQWTVNLKIPLRAKPPPQIRTKNDSSQQLVVMLGERLHPLVWNLKLKWHCGCFSWQYKISTAFWQLCDGCHRWVLVVFKVHNWWSEKTARSEVLCLVFPNSWLLGVLSFHYDAMNRTGSPMFEGGQNFGVLTPNLNLWGVSPHEKCDTSHERSEIRFPYQLQLQLLAIRMEQTIARNKILLFLLCPAWVD